MLLTNDSMNNSDKALAGGRDRAGPEVVREVASSGAASSKVPATKTEIRDFKETVVAFLRIILRLFETCLVEDYVCGCFFECWGP